MYCFAAAVVEYGVPAHIRIDRGGENYELAQIAIQARGRGGVIAGPSTRNQRIERFWRDVFDQVTASFYDFFRTLEQGRVIDLSNALHLIVIRVLYLPRYQVRSRCLCMPSAYSRSSYI